MNWRAYFTFSKRERVGVLSLLFVMAVLAILPKFWSKPPPKIEVVNLPPAIALDKVDRFKNYHDNFRNDDSVKSAGGRYYQYDRNYYRRRSGYPSRGADNWYRYSAHEPSIKNRVFNSRPSINEGSRGYRDEYPGYRYSSQSRLSVIDINKADTTALIALPGIGSRLASRIVSFREKLGGFYSVGQLREIYGLQDSVFQRIIAFVKCDTAGIKKVNINEGNEETLKQHPYIRWNSAKTIVAYRAAHGRFMTIDDLAKVNNLDSLTLFKLRPYIGL